MLKIGCDPELFVWSKDQETFVSAHNMFPGTKHEPFKLTHGAVQVDGMAVEFNTDPALAEDEFVHNVVETIREVKTFLPSGYVLKAVPTAVFDPVYFNSVPEEAKELGCDPDFNYSLMRFNTTPIMPNNTRFAGGHIHIGWEDEGVSVDDPLHIKACALMGRVFTDTLRSKRGSPQNRFLLNPYTKNRRLLTWRSSRYSRGMRAKPYGVEIRDPSNAWVLKEDLIRFMFRRAVSSFEYCKNASGRIEKLDWDSLYKGATFDVRY